MQTSKIRIKDLPNSNRPVERTVTLGSANSSEKEFLAILLGSGSHKQNVLELSTKILRQFSLKQLSTINDVTLKQISGVGQTKVARIIAAFEPGKRVYAQSNLTKTRIRSTVEAVNEVKALGDKKQEYLVVLYLNARHELLKKETIGIGSLNSMVITLKEVYSLALTSPCAAIIVADNHPSGDPELSTDDIKFTKRIHEAGEVVGITMLDHLVIA